MVTMTIVLPDTLADWVDQKVRDGGYRDTNEYLNELVARDRRQVAAGTGSPPTTEELRGIVQEADAGGVSGRTVRDIVAEGDRIARQHGFYRE